MLYAGLAVATAALVRGLHHVAVTSPDDAWVYTILDLPYVAAWYLGQVPSAAAQEIGSLPAPARVAATMLAGALVAGAMLLLRRLRRQGGTG